MYKLWSSKVGAVAVELKTERKKNPVNGIYFRGKPNKLYCRTRYEQEKQNYKKGNNIIYELIDGINFDKIL